jgi:hypothetical protein
MMKLNKKNLQKMMMMFILLMRETPFLLKEITRQIELEEINLRKKRSLNKEVLRVHNRGNQ